ncbi:pyridoxal 5'-phosphate synthase [Streptomyces sp. NPDC057638]|uniref:pyridoxine/pyridoxamine 5'-phosphate oxidase n=1 Tax=Streptomyces sp. NPDC057638 TaxID=3346190 RepID=UPI0036B1039E
MTHDQLRQDAFRALLHTQRVWDAGTAGLPGFAPAAAPASPLPLFHQWFTEAVAAGQPEPHTMALATVDGEGAPDLRTVMLHDADADGWHFGTHSTSAKGRQLAANPAAALAFYWHTQGRQIRVRGTVTAAGADASRADLRVRSAGALAAALTGRQSEPLSSAEALARASEAAWERARDEPDAPVPSWTLYVLAPREVEFFQGDAQRRHIRLRYRRTESGWARGLLWP